MSEALVTCAGQAVEMLHLSVPAFGPWVADVSLVEEHALTGAVTIAAGSTTLKGTVAEALAGSYGARTVLRIVAGAGAWASKLEAHHYNSDSGVKARTVVDDLIRLTGEKLGTFVPSAERIGPAFTRNVQYASETLTQVIGAGTQWWVDYDGVTQVGPRPAAELPADAYDLMAYDPLRSVVELGVYGLDHLRVGCSLSKDLGTTLVVKSFTVSITGAEMRARCNVGAASVLGEMLMQLVDRATFAKLHGKYRYRVLRQAADGRVDLQPLRKTAGLPDLLPLTMWPGLPGLTAKLSPSSEVLVEFIEGDRTLPVVTHFVDGSVSAPIEIVLGQSTQAAARQGDLVQSGGAGTVATFTPLTPPPTPTPAPLSTFTPYLISFSTVPPTPVTAAPLFGTVSTGSPRVRL